MEDNEYLEESVTMNPNALSAGKRKYVMYTIFTISLIAITAIFTLLLLFAEILLMLIPGGVCLFLVFFFLAKKKGCIYECDYISVGSSIRIAKVLNGVKRQALAVFDCDSIVAIGECDTQEFKAYLERKDLKLVVGTPNYKFETGNKSKIFYVVFKNQANSILVFQPSPKFMLNIAKRIKKDVLRATK